MDDAHYTELLEEIDIPAHLRGDIATFIRVSGRGGDAPRDVEAELRASVALKLSLRRRAVQ